MRHDRTFLLIVVWLAGMVAVPVDATAVVAEMSDQEVVANLYDWPQWARAAQLAPTGEDWSIWAFVAGRGSGKTRACLLYTSDAADE